MLVWLAVPSQTNAGDDLTYIRDLRALPSRPVRLGASRYPDNNVRLGQLTNHNAAKSRDDLTGESQVAVIRSCPFAHVHTMGKVFSVLAPRPDRLKVGPEISRGAYGTVYSGTLGGRPVAVKKMHQLLMDYASESEEALEAVLEGFRRECELSEAGKHRNLVEFLGVFNQDGSALLVMELMEQTLETFLKRKRGNLSQEKQIDICQQIASGLLFLHQHDPQILHRDLTAKNVLMNKDGSVAKISDLGQAKFRPSSVMYLSTTAPGCLLYMPPECLVETDKKSGAKARFTDKGDIFSLGVLMLEVTAQEPPSCGLVIVKGQPEVERRAADLSRLPADHPLRPLILQCLQDNPAKRPSCSEVWKELCSFHVSTCSISSGVLQYL